MILIYKYAFDSAYCKAVIARYYRQRPFFVRLPVQFSIPVLIVGIILMSWRKMDVSRAGATSLIVAGAMMIGVVLILVNLVKFGLFWKLKRNREFGAEVTISLSEDGLVASSRFGKAKVVWTAYPRAARFSDGILLVRGGAIRWLPDSALTSGTAADATSLVHQKSSLRNIA